MPAFSRAPFWRTPLLALSLVGVVGLAAAPALAQGIQRPGGFGQHAGVTEPRGNPLPFLSVSCSDDASARIEAMSAYLAARLEVTDEQANLLAALEADALQAQATFAASCDMPEEASPTEADPFARIAIRQAAIQARLDAVDAVLPALEAFYESLTPDQQALLLPARGAGAAPSGPPRPQGGPRVLAPQG